MHQFETPQHLGYYSYSIDAAIDDNPYSDGSDDAFQWARGWQLAETDFNAWLNEEY